MKSKQPFDLLRWMGGALLLVGLLAWVLANAAPGETTHAQPKSVSASVPSETASGADVQEVKERLKGLEDLTRQNYALELEGQRKKVDWWLSFLGVMLAGLAIFVTVAGIAIPYVMARKNKEIFDLDKKSIEQDKKSIEQDKNTIEMDQVQIRKLLDEVKGMKAEARVGVEEIHLHMEEIKAVKEAALKSQSGTPLSSDKEVQEAEEEIEQDKTADPLSRLRAEAVAASKPGNASKAYILWAALAELAVGDVRAQFNAGYWAHELGERAQSNEKLYWLREAEVKYARALSLKPDMYDAAHNLGLTLAKEAKALAATELDAARALWAQAGEKYQLALGIKPDMHDAAYSWGITLAAEAQALAAIAPAAARALWKQAGEKYQLALSIKPDKHDVANSWVFALLTEVSAVAASDPERSLQLLDQAEQLLLDHVDAAPGVVAYNLACVYGRRENVQSCLKWLWVSQQHGELPDCEHLRDDKDLDAVRNAPEFIEWLKQVCP